MKPYVKHKSEIKIYLIHSNLQPTKQIKIFLLNKRRILNENEVKLLKEGLCKQLKATEKEYGNMAHKTIVDTLVEKRKKETLEKQIQELEKDLKRIDKKIVKIDLTK